VLRNSEEADLAAIIFLRARDQLNIERGKGSVFQGFEEGVHLNRA
jgi:hypothetical protein